MTALLKAIHATRRDLAIDDDDYRAVLQRVTGKRSAKDLDDRQRRAVLDELRRLSGKPRRGLDGPYASKLVALWLSAWNLGIVRKRDDGALIAFVERQTGIDHVRWLREPRDAARAIEGLKAWIAREAGVEWPATQDVAATKQAVIDAQRRMLGDPPTITSAPLDTTIAVLGRRVRKLVP
ncbi:regulatory protein GemA [Sphingomonas sp. VNH70]|uniref:regulatory protein GemA n=1 Tax=Sphingomonas silueang TaxID=3156617 RepID=UPI0032B56034